METKDLTVKSKEKGLLKELEQYKDKPGYNLTLPPPGIIHLSPFITYDVSLVRIDTRKVDEGGEVHDLRGTFMPAAPAIFRLAEAWGIQFNSEKSQTKRFGDFCWSSKAVGTRRQPDGRWREGYAEYEFDAVLRGEELRLKMKGKSEFAIESMILDLKKYGLQRCVTGAQLALIHKLTGMRTGFKTIDELKANFVVYRFVDDVDAMMADPDMKRMITGQGETAKEEIYGPAKVRDVTPEPEALPEPEAQEEEAPEKEPEYDPFKDDEPDESPIDTARSKLEEWLLSNVLNEGSKEIIRATLKVPNVTLRALQDLLNRCEECKARKEANAKGVAK